MGRTGRWFAHHEAGITPDLVTVAKGLGNGFPIGACIGIGPAGALLGPGNHGSTFGGNPVAAMAGLATIGVIERDGLLEHTNVTGAWLAESLRALDHRAIAEVRQAGLLVGIQLHEPVAARVVDAALPAGFIVNAATPDVIRLAPPLIVTQAQLQTFLDVLPGLLDGALEGTGS